MPDSRRHRGAHPEDAHDFPADKLSALQRAVEELSFLFGREYAVDAALKVVGDHHQLTSRQRKAVLRASCGDGAAKARALRRRTMDELKGQSLFIDGFNCLITLEAMLSGAPLFRGRDLALRDLASVHGTYRNVEETVRAIDLMLAALKRYDVGSCTLLLDRPVGNSGRTRALIEQRSASSGQLLTVVLTDRVDQELAHSGCVVASSDAWILDGAAAWVDVPQTVAIDHDVELWLVDLSAPAQV